MSNLNQIFNGWIFPVLVCVFIVWRVEAAICGGLFQVNNLNFGQRVETMIQTLINYGIKNENVLDAMRKVPRHEFIPESYRGMADAYGDHPCPIGFEQTISQPFIVAYMTEKIAPIPHEKILEIGTGSGYQAAILAELGAEVYSIEIVKELAQHADKVLRKHGFNVKVLCGDGYKGWSENAPFDVVIVTCAPETIPPALIEQLKIGGRMILPVGEHGFQRLTIVKKSAEGIKIESDLPVRFVPMVQGKGK